MTPLPWLQWYPADHRAEPWVRLVSFEARGLWREMLDLMHGGEPYGHLTAGGKAITDEQLATLVGLRLKQLRLYLSELESHKVFSRTEAGVIYSRRMVRDEQRRATCQRNGAKGGNPALVRMPRRLSKGGEIPITESDNRRASRSDIARSQKSESVLEPESEASEQDEAGRDLPTFRGRLPARPRESQPLLTTTQSERGGESAPDLPANATALVRAFYPRADARSADVQRQLTATLSDNGVPFRDGYVRASSPEQLDSVCEAVLANPPDDADAAIVFVLMKLRDGRGLEIAGGPVERRAVSAREAGLLVRQILALRQRTGSSRYIPLGKVEALGADVGIAYRRVGGADRFLASSPRDEWRLIEDFRTELVGARKAAGTDDGAQALG